MKFQILWSVALKNKSRVDHNFLAPSQCLTALVVLYFYKIIKCNNSKNIKYYFLAYNFILNFEGPLNIGCPKLRIFSESH